jgi:hypothetical protein
MTNPPPSPNPLGPDAPTRDYVPLAIAAMGFAIVAGTGIIALVTWTVRTLQTGSMGSGPPSLGSAPAVVLLVGTMGGLLFSATSVWVALAPVRSPYRQGGLAMATTFATLLASVVSTFLADNFAGRGGLLLLTIVAVVLAWKLGHRVGRLRAELG